MATQTMTEKDMFLKNWENEFAITRRTLAATPAGKEEFRPVAISRSLRELVWIFLSEEKVIEGVMQPGFQPQGPPPAPALAVAELVKMYEASHRTVYEKVKRLSMEEFEHVIKFPIAPRTLGDVRVADVCWMMVMDAVHHRGQLSVYLRMLGAKVPSIYGPTAEEPWF